MRRHLSLTVIALTTAVVTSASAQQHQPRWMTSAQTFPEASLPLLGAPALGNSGAPAQIVAFLNYQCPYSARLFETFREAARRAPEAFRVSVMHYPLDAACNPNMTSSMHPNACGAARAAICAQEQGRFWEMSDGLFQAQRQLNPSTVDAVARQSQLDMNRFSACLASQLPDQRLALDISAASQVPVRGTPLMIVNDRVVNGAMRIEEFTDMLKHLSDRRGNW